MALTEEENEYILKLYELSEKTPRVAVELFKKEFGYLINRITIKKRWKNAGFTLQDRGGLRRGFDRECFIEFYNKHEGDLGSMIKETGYQKNSLIKLCSKHDLERPK